MQAPTLVMDSCKYRRLSRLFLPRSAWCPPFLRFKDEVPYLAHSTTEHSVLLLDLCHVVDGLNEFSHGLPVQGFPQGVFLFFCHHVSSVKMSYMVAKIMIYLGYPKTFCIVIDVSLNYSLFFGTRRVRRSSGPFLFGFVKNCLYITIAGWSCLKINSEKGFLLIGFLSDRGYPPVPPVYFFQKNETYFCVWHGFCI